MGSTASIISAALSVVNPVNGIMAQSGLTAKRSKDGMDTAKRAPREAADRQRADAEKLATEAETRRTNEEGAAAAAETGQAARKRQRALASGAQGRRSTILTGPLGVVDDANVARKSILGA